MKKVRMANSSMETFKVKASDVFEKIDERFNRQAEQNEQVRTEMRNEIRALGDKIDAQIHTFDKQLSKLNDNMESVLNRIQDHENRLMKLENDSQEKKYTTDAWRSVLGFAKDSARGIIYLLVALGAAYGVKPLLKLFNLFSL